MNKNPKTRKGQATKTKMIQVAAGLIHKNGITATTVNDVLEESNTGKSQFSHYFGSKEEMVTAVIDYHQKTIGSKIKELIFRINSMSDMYKLCEFYKLKSSEFLSLYNGGSPIGQMALEVAGDQDQIRNKLHKFFHEISEALTSRFEVLQKNGKIKAEANVKELAEFFMGVVEGGFVLTKTQQTSAPLARCLEHGSKYLLQYAN